MKSLSLYTEKELLQGLQEGDEAIFKFIYHSYLKKLIRYARKIIKDKEDCEEIVQEVFISLWSRHSELHHVFNLEAYLFRMVKYKMIRYFQHSKVKQKYAAHYLVFEAVYDTAQGDEREIINLRTTINKTLSELPDRCQEAVRLRIDEELSNGEIAERMNIKKSTVTRYMTEALMHFKEKHPPIYKDKPLMKVEEDEYPYGAEIEGVT